MPQIVFATTVASFEQYRENLIHDLRSLIPIPVAPPEKIVSIKTIEVKERTQQFVKGNLQWRLREARRENQANALTPASVRGVFEGTAEVLMQLRSAAQFR